MSAGQELAKDRPSWFVVVGLFGVGLLLLVAAVIGVLLQRLRPAPLLLRICGWGIASVLLIRGVGIEILLLTGALDTDSGITSEQIMWTHLVWNPWFVFGGVCYLMATVLGTRPHNHHLTEVPTG